ncbi:hypothetical protein OUZ56_004695 [Daphnia magna]|uniref:Uncharacterized protein n=1 Tax=Daphnia magna TaxID=35525 RepID=A0ABQ9YQK4_9CRUS|nr:hypothetical protein OUZ56_004695 [Daphnia magna]
MVSRDQPQQAERQSREQSQTETPEATAERAQGTGDVARKKLCCNVVDNPLIHQVAYYYICSMFESNVPFGFFIFYYTDERERPGEKSPGESFSSFLGPFLHRPMLFCCHYTRMRQLCRDPIQLIKKRKTEKKKKKKKTSYVCVYICLACKLKEFPNRNASAQTQPKFAYPLTKKLLLKSMFSIEYISQRQELFSLCELPRMRHPPASGRDCRHGYQAESLMPFVRHSWKLWKGRSH